MAQEQAMTRYNLVVKNRPGELVKLTKVLTSANVNLSALRVANLGDKASIQFATPKGCVLPQRLRRARVD